MLLLPIEILLLFVVMQSKNILTMHLFNITTNYEIVIFIYLCLYCHPLILCTSKPKWVCKVPSQCTGARTNLHLHIESHSSQILGR